MTRRRRNFLADLIHEDEQKPRRQCKAPATLYYCKKGLREYTAQKAVIFETSTATCKTSCPVPDAVSGDVYLVIEKLRVKIPCSVLRRSEEDLELKFYEEIPSELAERLCVLR